MAAPTLNALLKFMVEREVIELHLKPLSPPRIRRGLLLEDATDVALSVAEVKQIIYSLLRDRDKLVLERDGNIGRSFRIKGLGEFYCRVYHQGGMMCATYQHSYLEEIDWEIAVGDILTEVPRPGLYLVGGRTELARRMNLLSLMKTLNNKWKFKYLVFSDVEEFISQEKTTVERLALTSDEDWENVFRTIMNVGGDVVAFERMYRSVELQEVLNVALRGVPVFAAATGRDACDVMTNFIQTFPAYRHAGVRRNLARSLRWVIVREQVAPLFFEESREVVDMLNVEDTVREMVAREKWDDIFNYMAANDGSFGVKSLYVSLVKMINEGHFNAEEALAVAPDREKLQQLIATRKRGSRRGWIFSR